MKILKHITLFSVGILCFPHRAFTKPLTAQEIMQKADSRPKAATMKALAVMTLLDQKGNRRDRQINMFSRRTDKGTDSFSEFLSPADVAGTRFLTIGNKTEGDDQRLYLPELKKVRRIAKSGKSGSFMGSDLSYYDMEEHDPDDFLYTLLREESLTVTRNNKKEPVLCYVIQGILKDADAPYKKTIVWTAKDDPLVLKTEAYDHKENLVKTIYMAKVTITGGIAVTDILLVAATDGHKTMLTLNNVEINRGVGDEIFTVQYLEK